LLFIPFYPLVILLHLVGLGGVFDTLLIWLFSLPKESVDNILPLWMTAIYMLLSIGAIWYKKLFHMVMGLAFGYGFYLFIV